MAKEHSKQPTELNEAALDDASGGIIAVKPQEKAPPASSHPGGVNVLMADGSVRFIKNSI